MNEVRALVVMKAGVRPADVAPHPGTPHRFEMICLDCGEPGMLHVAVIAPGERVELHEAALSRQAEKETA